MGDPLYGTPNHLEWTLFICQDTTQENYARVATYVNKRVTNFIWSYLHQFFDDSHGLKASLKPLIRPFYQYQSRLEAITNGRDIRQINW